MGRDEGKLGDRILALLADEASPLDDDAIAARIRVARQHVNQCCRRLARTGLLERDRGKDGKFVNHRARPAALAVDPAASPVPTPAQQPPAVRLEEPRPVRPHIAQSASRNGRGARAVASRNVIRLAACSGSRVIVVRRRPGRSSSSNLRPLCRASRRALFVLRKRRPTRPSGRRLRLGT